MLRDMKFPLSEGQPRLDLTPFARRIIATCNQLLVDAHPNTRPRDFVVSAETREKLAECYDNDLTAKAKVDQFMAIMGVPIKVVDGLMHNDGVMLRVWKEDYYVAEVQS